MAEKTEFEKIVAKYDGWTVAHALEPRTRQSQAGKGAATTVLVEEGHYIALKRHPNGNSLVEFAGVTPDEVERQIEGWENEQSIATHPAAIDADSAANSARATRFMGVSASARDIVANPDAHAAAVEQREGATSDAELAASAAKAVEKAVESVTAEVKKAGGTDVAAKDAADVARSAVEKAVVSQPKT